MKRLFLILILFSSCTFIKKHRAERLVTAYLDTTLANHYNYESVSTEIDTFWHTPLSDPSYQKLLSQLVDVKWKLNNLNTEMFLKDDNKKNWDDTTNIILLGIDSAEIQKKMNSIRDTFKTKPDGWLVAHYYKIKNGPQKFKLHKILIHTNDDFSKIVVVEKNK